jgi:hypothetical protein
VLALDVAELDASVDASATLLISDAVTVQGDRVLAGAALLACPPG